MNKKQIAKLNLIYPEYNKDKGNITERLQEYCSSITYGNLPNISLPLTESTNQEEFYWRLVSLECEAIEYQYRYYHESYKMYRVCDILLELKGWLSLFIKKNNMKPTERYINLFSFESTEKELEYYLAQKKHQWDRNSKEMLMNLELVKSLMWNILDNTNDEFQLELSKDDANMMFRDLLILP